MQRPTWATVVGIIGIIMGGFGVLGGMQTLTMPSMMKMQQEMMNQMGAQMEQMAAQAQRSQTAPQPGGTTSSTSPADTDAAADTNAAAAPAPGPYPPSAPPAMPVFPTRPMQRMFQTPPWFSTFCVVTGILALIFAAIYVIASIMLLMVKRTAIAWMYTALGLFLMLGLVRIGAAVTAMADGSFTAMGIGMGAGFGFVIDLVLLIVVAAADKSAYGPPEEEDEAAPA